MGVCRHYQGLLKACGCQLVLKAWLREHIVGRPYGMTIIYHVDLDFDPSTHIVFNKERHSAGNSRLT